MIPFYMIANLGTLAHSGYAQQYPYHMLLAHLCLKSSAYRAVAGYLTSRRGESHVILDNGAYENSLVHDDDYLDLITELRPNTAVLPDLVNAITTVSRARSMDFAKRLLALSEHCQPRLMYVPQGDNLTEVFWEYDWAVNNLPAERFVLGVGKAYKLWEDIYGPGDKGRTHMLQSLARVGGELAYHLLGARWNPEHMTIPQEMRLVGLDSAKPCACALVDNVYPSHDAHPRLDHLSSEVSLDSPLRRNVEAIRRCYKLDD